MLKLGRIRSALQQNVHLDSETGHQRKNLQQRSRPLPKTPRKQSREAERHPREAGRDSPFKAGGHGPGEVVDGPQKQFPVEILLGWRHLRVERVKAVPRDPRGVSLQVGQRESFESTFLWNYLVTQRKPVLPGQAPNQFQEKGEVGQVHQVFQTVSVQRHLYGAKGHVEHEQKQTQQEKNTFDEAELERVSNFSRSSIQ